jgi:uncharacterized membrane protein
MTTLLIGLALFLGVHSISIVNVAWRDDVVTRIGKRSWQALYSVVVLAGLILIIYGYGLARQAPVLLYVPPLWLRNLTLLLMLPVFILLLAPYLPGRIKMIVPHPMLLATKLWALAHLFANGTLADVVLFGSLILWAGMDRVSMKRRDSRPVPGLPASGWNDLLVFLLASVLYVAFIGGVHSWLIGVPIATPWG